MFRMGAAVAAGFIPPTLALIAISASGTQSLRGAILAILAGIGAGGFAAFIVARTVTRRAERLEAMATALRAHRQPAHVLPDDRDVMGAAERKLLQAADAVIGEIESLAEQRDELEAILRSMTDAVVVTGGRGEVVLLNGQARRTFALSLDANYQGRDFVELCRDPRLQIGRAHV